MARSTARRRWRQAPPAPLTVRGVPTDPNLRVLALATLVNTLGNGALTTTFALYFTHVVGLRATQVGLALSVAALVGLLVQVPMGHLGDVRGPRELLRAAHDRRRGRLARAAAHRRHLAARAGARRPGGVRPGRQRGPQRADRPPGRGRPGGRFKAYLRAVTNVGISFGALLGGLALWVDRPWAYLAVFALNARHLRRSPRWWSVGCRTSSPRRPGRRAQPRLQVLRDLPYVVVTRPDRDLRHPLPRDGAGGAAVAGDPHRRRRSGSWPSSC